MYVLLLKAWDSIENIKKKCFEADYKSTTYAGDTNLMLARLKKYLDFLLPEVWNKLK